MKLRRIMVLTGFTAAAAFAQVSGSITISGSIPDAVSLTDASGSAISATQTLGALTVANNSNLASITPVDVYVRSNKAFSLSASATLTGFGSDGSSISAGDVGFGVVAEDHNGGLVTSGFATTYTSKFDYTTTAFSGLPVSNGLSPFVAGTNGTLNDIATATQVLQGPRVSQRGNIQTNSNAVKYSFGAATLPQYFTPTASFQAVITLTVATL